MERNDKRFRIPNRDVKLTDYEVAVTHTKAFQRLFHLKQLGLAYLVYPCATHTRAGHSIECLDEAAKLLNAIKGDQDEEYRHVRMAALLHDIGHIPFSHTLEDENEVLQKHDKGERLNIVLDKLKNEVGQDVRKLIDKATPILLAISSDDEKEHDWRSDLVGNTVCADLLAYITTDAAWTGIEKRPGYYRIYDYFIKTPEEIENVPLRDRLCIRLTKGGLRTDIVSAILDLLDMRYALTERVIVHHAKAIASAMLARASRLAGLKEDAALLDMGDEMFIAHLTALANNNKDKEAAEGSKMLIDHLRSRRLYKRIFKVQRHAMEEWDRTKQRNDGDTFSMRWRKSEEIEKLLSQIEERHDLPRGSIVLWCPEAKSSMKLVRVKVVWEQSGGWHKPVELRSKDVQKQFPGIHDRVDNIEQQYLDLWTFWIGIHPDYLKMVPGVIEDLSSGLDIECDPVFLETYAKDRLPEYAESAKLYDSVKNTLRKNIVPEVQRRLLDLAARPGTQVDEAIITDTIHNVSAGIGAGGKKAKKSEKTGQLGLSGIDEIGKEKPSK